MTTSPPPVSMSENYNDVTDEDITLSTMDNYLLDNITGMANTTEHVHSVVEEGKKLLPFLIGTYIHLYYLPMVIIVGTIGNMLSFAVMMQVSLLCILKFPKYGLSVLEELFVSFWFIKSLGQKCHD